MPKLEILSGKREGDVVDLPSDGLDIGNRKNAKLSIRDPWISFSHAKIVCEDGRFVIEDLGSSNGVSVNGKKVTRHPLQASDEILLGKTRLRFVETDSGLPSLPDAEQRGSTLRLTRPDVDLADGSAERAASLEREVDELRRMKEVLERFLDMPPEARKARMASSSGAGVDLEAAEKARQVAVAKVVELEGKLSSAEARAVDAENRLKGSVEDKKKEISKLKARQDEDLSSLVQEKTQAEDARARAEARAAELEKRVETAAADANARADRIARELETARKSAIDAEARSAKLERDLDASRRASGRLTASGAAASSPETDTLRADLAAAHAERDALQRRYDDTRQEIDRISMEQIDLEDTLRKKIAELEARLSARQLTEGALASETFPPADEKLPSEPGTETSSAPPRAPADEKLSSRGLGSALTQPWSPIDEKLEPEGDKLSFMGGEKLSLGAPPDELSLGPERDELSLSEPGSKLSLGPEPDELSPSKHSLGPEPDELSLGPDRDSLSPDEKLSFQGETTQKLPFGGEKLAEKLTLPDDDEDNLSLASEDRLSLAPEAHEEKLPLPKEGNLSSPPDGAPAEPT